MKGLISEQTIIECKQVKQYIYEYSYEDMIQTDCNNYKLHFLKYFQTVSHVTETLSDQNQIHLSNPKQFK